MKTVSPETNALIRRAEQLDALYVILPFDRRDQLAALLPGDDVATLKHHASEGMGANRLLALAADIGHLEAWCSLATGAPLPWPAPESLLLKFLAHHLCDPAKRETNPENGMPEDVSASLRTNTAAERRAACAGYGSPPPRQLVDSDALARFEG